MLWSHHWYAVVHIVYVPLLDKPDDGLYLAETSSFVDLIYTTYDCVIDCNTLPISGCVGHNKTAL